MNLARPFEEILSENGGSMAAVTLWQPSATLVAIGAKRIETRPRRTRHRGLIAIHAASKLPPYLATDLMCADLTALTARAIRTAGYHDWLDLPLGCVVAVARIADCRATRDLIFLNASDPVPGDRMFVSHQERTFGDFSPGRYAWMLEDVTPVDPPYYVKGRQGIWRIGKAAA